MHQSKPLLSACYLPGIVVRAHPASINLPSSSVTWWSPFNRGWSTGDDLTRPRSSLVDSVTPEHVCALSCMSSLKKNNWQWDSAKLITTLQTRAQGQWEIQVFAVCSFHLCSQMKDWLHLKNKYCVCKYVSMFKLTIWSVTFFFLGELESWSSWNVRGPEIRLEGRRVARAPWQSRALIQKVLN